MITYVEWFREAHAIQEAYRLATESNRAYGLLLEAKKKAAQKAKPAQTAPEEQPLPAWVRPTYNPHPEGELKYKRSRSEIVDMALANKEHGLKKAMPERMQWWRPNDKDKKLTRAELTFLQNLTHWPPTDDDESHLQYLRGLPDASGSVNPAYADLVPPEPNEPSAEERAAQKEKERQEAEEEEKQWQLQHKNKSQPQAGQPTPEAVPLPKKKEPQQPEERPTFAPPKVWPKTGRPPGLPDDTSNVELQRYLHPSLFSPRDRGAPRPFGAEPIKNPATGEPMEDPETGKLIPASRAFKRADIQPPPEPTGPVSGAHLGLTIPDLTRRAFIRMMQSKAIPPEKQRELLAKFYPTPPKPEIAAAATQPSQPAEDEDKPEQQGELSPLDPEAITIRSFAEERKNQVLDIMRNLFAAGGSKGGYNIRIPGKEFDEFLHLLGQKNVPVLRTYQTGTAAGRSLSYPLLKGMGEEGSSVDEKGKVVKLAASSFTLFPTRVFGESNNKDWDEAMRMLIYDANENPILVCRDEGRDYIADGHHRWLAKVLLEMFNRSRDKDANTSHRILTIPAVLVDMPLDALRQAAKQWMNRRQATMPTKKDKPQSAFVVPEGSPVEIESEQLKGDDAVASIPANTVVTIRKVRMADGYTTDPEQITLKKELAFKGPQCLGLDGNEERFEQEYTPKDAPNEKWKLLLRAPTQSVLHPKTTVGDLRSNRKNLGRLTFTNYEPFEGDDDNPFKSRDAKFRFTAIIKDEKGNQKRYRYFVKPQYVYTGTGNDLMPLKDWARQYRAPRKRKVAPAQAGAT